jgi:hypothetical protein
MHQSASACFSRTSFKLMTCCMPFALYFGAGWYTAAGAANLAWSLLHPDLRTAPELLGQLTTATLLAITLWLSTAMVIIMGNCMHFRSYARTYGLPENGGPWPDSSTDNYVMKCKDLEGRGICSATGLTATCLYKSEVRLRRF